MKKPVSAYRKRAKLQWFFRKYCKPAMDAMLAAARENLRKEWDREFAKGNHFA